MAKLALEVFFSQNPRSYWKASSKTAKMGVFAYFGGTESGTSGARIKILRPLFNTNTPLKPQFRHFGNHFGTRKSDFWPFYFFGHFPIEIPIEAEGTQNSHFPGSENSTLIFW